MIKFENEDAVGVRMAVDRAGHGGGLAGVGVRDAGLPQDMGITKVVS